MRATISKTGLILSLFSIILLCPFNLFADGTPVSGLSAALYSGVDLYGYSTIEVNASWNPWELMIQCNPQNPPKNALIYYDVSIYTAREVVNCLSGGIGSPSRITTNSTSYSFSIPANTLYLEISICAYYILPSCSGSTCTTPAKWTHNFTCDYVDFPRMPPDTCAVKAATAGEPVNVTNGQMHVTHTDFSLHGKGIDLEFSRTYSNRFQTPLNSTIKISSSLGSSSYCKSAGEAKYIERYRISCMQGVGFPIAPLTLNMLKDGIPSGYGWTHSLNRHLDIMMDGDTVRYFDQNGTSQQFTKNVNPDGPYSPAYTWITSTLIKNQDNTYTLSEEGIKYRFDSKGRLINISDSYSNQINLLYDTSDKLTTVTDTIEKQITFQYDSKNRLTSITGPEGLLVGYEYSLSGLLTKATYPDSSNITYQYNDPYDNMNLTNIIDQNGHNYSYTYDASDRVVKVERDNSNEKITFSNYNTIASDSYSNPPVISAPIQTTTVTNSRGYTTTYRYITKGNGFAGNGLPLMFQISGVGCSSCSEGNSTYLWDSNGNMISSTDAGGTKIKYESYDSRGNPGIVKKAYGTSDQQDESYTYHPVLSAPLSVTRKSVLNPVNNKMTIFDYDDDYDNIPNENPTFRITRLVEKGFTKDENTNITSYEYIITYAYNSYGQLISIDGPKTDVSDVTTFTYYPDDLSYGYNRSQLHQITDPVGNIYTYSNYDIYSNPGQVVDANNVITNYAYDSKGRVKTISAENNLTSFFYDSKGNVDYIILPEGNIIDYTYDAVDRLTGITRRNNNFNAIDSITYTYDTEGNKTSEAIRTADINGEIKKQTGFEYDQWNKLTKIIPATDNPAKFFKFFNLSNGPVSKEKDGNTSDGLWSAEYIYDSLLRIKQIKNLPDNFITGFNYDLQDNLTQVTDTNNNTTVYAYDDIGRLVRVQSPDTGVTSYSYDPAGNLISKTDARNITANYTYDSLNRLTNIDLPGTNDDIIFTYDSISVSNGKGRLTEMSDSSGYTVYHYDTLGRITEEERNIDNRNYITTYSYDLNGNLTGIAYPSGTFVHYTYDAADRITGIAVTGNQGLSSVINAGYIPFGGLSSMAFGNGASENISYDNQYRIINKSVSNQLSVKSYGYDNNSNITTITDSLDSSKTQSFSYDALNRLTSATLNSQPLTLNYTYDPIGNRLSETKNSDTTTYTYQANRLTSSTQHSALNTQHYSYDPSGNLTSDSIRNFIYNQNNRLIRISENGIIEGEYVYDGNGKRISKEIKGNWFIYHYDINGNIISVSDRNGNKIADYIYIGNERVGMLLPETETEPSGAYKKVKSRTGVSPVRSQGSRKLLGRFRGSVSFKNGKASIKFRRQGSSGKGQGARSTDDELPATSYKTNLEDIISISSNSISWDNTNKNLSGEVSVINNDSENALYNLDVRIKWISTSGVTIYNEDGKVNNKPYWYYGNLDKNGGTSSKQWIFSDPDVESFDFAASIYGDFTPPGEKIYYFHNDHLGTPLMITDENREVVWSADYEPFGKIYQQSGTVKNNFRFPGQYYDSESGLYYNMMRDYDPEIGRYIEPDPIGQWGDVNLYAYVGNNPVNAIDPEGLFLLKYHEEITRRALEPFFTKTEINIIIAANKGQDIFGFYKPQFHYDNNGIKASREYYLSQLQIALFSEDRLEALQAFGRALHTTQDFYSHSNYIERKLGFEKRDLLTGTFDPLNPNDILGKTFDFNSHGWINKDDPSRKYFQEAYKEALRISSNLGKIVSKNSQCHFK